MPEQRSVNGCRRSTDAILSPEFETSKMLPKRDRIENWGSTAQFGIPHKISSIIQDCFRFEI